MSVWNGLHLGLRRPETPLSPGLVSCLPPSEAVLCSPSGWSLNPQRSSAICTSGHICAAHERTTEHCLLAPTWFRMESADIQRKAFSTNSETPEPPHGKCSQASKWKCEPSFTSMNLPKWGLPCGSSHCLLYTSRAHETEADL
eukprot:3803468-Amphidinium_carterae.1